jgi:hypothetical protein
VNARSVAYGIAAGAAVAIVYAVFAEVLSFRLGLLVIGFCGGWLIGNGMAYGRWTGREHEPVPALQWAALTISVIAWVGALVLSFAISQALLPEASTSLGERLTLANFAGYVFGFGIERIVDVIALALMALMAWRGAR